MVKRMGRGERKRRRKRIMRVVGVGIGLLMIGITAATLLPRLLMIGQPVTDKQTDGGGKAASGESPAQPDESSSRQIARLELPARLQEGADPWGPMELEDDDTPYIWSEARGLSESIHENLLAIPAPEDAEESSQGPFVPGVPLAKARAFLAAATMEEKLAHVRNPDKARPLLEKFFADRDSATPSTLALAYERLYQVEDVVFAGVGKNGNDFLYRSFAVVFTDGTRRLLAVVKQQGDEGLAVDVPAFLRLQNEGCFRVFVSRDSYYNFDYDDATLWNSYRLASPDWEETYSAYTRRGSQADHQLRMLLRPDKETSEHPAAGAGARQTLVAHAMVEIAPGYDGQFPERRQVEIVRFRQRGWVRP